MPRMAIDIGAEQREGKRMGPFHRYDPRIARSTGSSVSKKSCTVGSKEEL